MDTLPGYDSSNALQMQVSITVPYNDHLKTKTKNKTNKYPLMSVNDHSSVIQIQKQVPAHRSLCYMLYITRIGGSQMCCPPPPEKDQMEMEKEKQRGRGRGRETGGEIKT